MKKYIKRLLFQVVTSLFMIVACDEKKSNEPNLHDTPMVKIESTYGISYKNDILYAEGLGHKSINSANYIKIPLKLDVYTPNNEEINRPAYLFIHGGAFTTGSKKQSEIINLSNYYASRGWVFISIDYRLKDQFGTVPQEWLDYSSHLPSDSVALFLSMYPAQRDAKAAMRWVVANAETYNINTNYITVGGSSAGAVTAITLGISEHQDFRDELNLFQDPTLASTNVESTYQIKTIIDYWGSKMALDALKEVYGVERFNENNPPLFIAHRIKDPIIPYSNAENLKNIYYANKVPLAYYPLQGNGHGAWNVQIDNKRLEELTFDFIVEHQRLLTE
jgi:para-nitrobenzyl esterase